MLFADRLTLDAPRRTKDGFLAVRAKAARTGVYDYAGFEVDPNNEHGLRDQAIVKVLRDDSTVFDKNAAASFIGKPITDNHPAEAVTADNWRKHARGTIMGAIRDGEYLAFDLLLTDAEAIAAVNGGKRELSNGYSSALEFGTFTASDGTICQARQTNISGNHVALVDRGRAGPECSIKDAFATCDANLAVIRSYFKETNVKKITLDGLQVDLSDADAVAAAFAKLEDKAATANKALEDARAEVSAKDGAIAALEKQLADAKAEAEPAAIEKRVADRAALIADAKKVKADLVADGKADADIRREVVAIKLGDAATTLDDAAIAGAFAVIVKDAKPVDPVRQAINDGQSFAVSTESIRDAARRFRNA